MPETQAQDFPARVVEVVDDYRVVINRGAATVRKGQRFLIYAIGKELFDPETNESLGRLEVVRGTGVVTHVQEKICTISSDRKTSPLKRTMRPSVGVYAIFQNRDEVIEEQGSEIPFDDPAIGDHAKPV